MFRDSIELSLHRCFCSCLTVVMLNDNPFQENQGNQTGQSMPNTCHRSTRPAPSGNRFEPLNPGSKDFSNCIVSQVLTTEVNIPELRAADNDCVAALSAQQEGSGHFDAYRSIASAVGACARRSQIFSTSYHIVGFVRTIEEVIGLPQLDLNEADGVPMRSAFDLNRTKWNSAASAFRRLQVTSFSLPKLLVRAANSPNCPTMQRAEPKRQGRGLHRRSLALSQRPIPSFGRA